MSIISFCFTPDTDRNVQERILGRLKQMPGVRTAGRIDSDSPDQDIARMCFAESVNPSDVSSIIDELQQSAAVERVAVEPRRGLF